MTMGLRRHAVLVIASLSLVRGAYAEGGATQKAIAGRPEYDKSGYYTFTFGEGYRKEWTTPFAEAVLDLKTFAGGLTPVRQVGSMQSIGLALKGADGKSYTFRTFDKDPTKLLPEEWRNSLPASIFQDQTIASHPGSALMVPTLAEAAGVPHTNPVAVYMPDDPALGEFRATFANKPGMIDEYPLPAGNGSPGFRGATEIISTAKLWERWLAGKAVVDARALLRCRLFDMFIGDWDRHNGQWRWMHVPGHDGLLPLPEDRDQAFSNFSGVMLSMARHTTPRLIGWRRDYENMPGLLYQGREVDDWLLIGQDREAYREVGLELQRALTDAVIEAAVQELPPEWYALRGPALVSDLKKRRDLLPQGAEAFYEELAKYVDVQGTNQDDAAELVRAADGSATLQLSAGGQTYLRRHFGPKETRELRIVLHGGNDRFVASGPRGGFTVRVSGGTGTDKLDDSASGGTKFYDVDREGEVVRGPGTSASDRVFEPTPRKKETPWLSKQDFGALTTVLPVFWWEPDPGIVVSLAAAHYRYGYRKEPYSSMQTAAIEWKSKRGAFAFSYNADVRWRKPGFSTLFQSSLDGAKNYNYYGVGNETVGEEDDFTEADQELASVFTSVLAYENRRRTYWLAAGPDVRYSQNHAASDTFIGTTKPYGFGDFGEVGGRLRFELDTRGRSLAGLGAQGLAPGKQQLRDTGLKLSLDARSYPKAWDVEDAFTSAEGAVTGYWQPTSDLTLAGRLGGQKVWGRYPWFEAAFIGGSDTVRGYGRNRFAGDSSLYGNAEVLLGLFNMNLILPLRVGILGAADTGRVWVEGETSTKWHPSYGGGIFVRVLTTRVAFYSLLAHGDEGNHFHVNIGLGL